MSICSLDSLVLFVAMETKMQKQKKGPKFSHQKPYALIGKNFIEVVIMLAFTPFKF